ncbi:MAG TPA: Hsp20 family protein [Noviherbaspirillum sp.]|nr:Hsp20 family protein [Noviherbaspirillum sp.]
MAKIEQSVEINAPARAAYEQLTKFEQYSRFMDSVKEIRQLDDTHLHLRSSDGAQEMEWDAEITEQIPDRCIGWRTTSGPHYEGRIELSPVDMARTRVTLTMECEPRQQLLPQLGNAENVIAQRTVHDLAQFKKFIEKLTGDTRLQRERDANKAGMNTGPAGLFGAQQAHSAGGEDRSAFPDPLQLWRDPFGLMRRMTENMTTNMDQFMDKYLGRPLNDARLHGASPAGWTPPVEVAHREQQFIVCAELPGVRREDVHIEIKRDRLTIEGERNPEPSQEAGEFRRSERSYGHFYRVISLPAGADTGSASAAMRDGVLKITVPLPDKGMQPRKLEIQAPEN